MFPPLFVIFLSLCVFANEVTGEIDWIALPETEKLYSIGNTPMSWLDSWKYCYDLGTELLSLTNPSEEKMLINYLFTKYGKQHRFWSSGNIMPNKKEKANKKVWFWMSSGQPIFEPKWCPGEPNDESYTESCLLLYTSLACWNDAVCHDTNHDGINYFAICNKYNEIVDELVEVVQEDPCDGNEETGEAANRILTEVRVNGKQIPVNNQTVTSVNLSNGAVMGVEIDVAIGDKNNA